MIFRYDSIAQFRQTYIDMSPKNMGYGENLSWYGNESEAESLRKAELGDTSLVGQAEAQLDSLDAAIETPRRIWERSVAGPFCCVPDVLAGLPTPMRRMTHQTDEHNPITIFVDTGSTASVSAKQITQRGTTILALVLALTRVRPVQLFQLHAGYGKDGETITTCQINTSPLDLATACYVLTSAGFTRRLVYNLASKRNGYNGTWARGFNTYKQEEYFDKLKPKLTNDVKNCLIVPKALINDELLTEPILWLNAQIQRFTQSQEEEQNHG